MSPAEPTPWLLQQVLLHVDMQKRDTSRVPALATSKTHDTGGKTKIKNHFKHSRVMLDSERYSVTQ